MTAAEEKIRAAVLDQNASFSAVQLTGATTTGQTCGQVTARRAADGAARTGRFIVYVDGTAGPFIENGVGTQFMRQESFAEHWRLDCVGEGYLG